MEGGNYNELITGLAVIGGLVIMLLLLIWAVGRARKARRRQIEESDEARPLPGKKRPALSPEDVVPEEAPPKPKGKKPAPVEEPVEEEEEEEEEEAPLPEAKPEPPKPAHVAVPEAKPEVPEAKPEVAKAPALEKAKPEIKLPQEKPRAVEPAPSPPITEGRLEPSPLVPGLARTRAGWISRLGQIFAGKREIDPALVEEIEKVLLTADIGVRTSQKLLEEIRSSLSRREIADPASVWEFLRRRSSEILRVEAPPVDYAKAKPFVLLTIGVNGSGKTTTIGKLASKLKASGKSVLLAAGDTFRAAATEQLEVWGSRVSAPVVRGKEGGDPSSVIFDGIKRAIQDGIDVVIADTAGRLHTKTNLMDELQKIRRVASKALDGAPHETWLVIDATSGQNAIAQAQVFTQAMSVTGIVLTKLDGTAKGGVILGIADQLGIPVRYVGIGERVDDLREFSATEFVDALFEDAQTGSL